MKQKWIDKYEESLDSHLEHFAYAAKILGVSNLQIEEHDLSKHSKEEYEAYVKYFGGDLCDEATKEEFDYAWNHHLHNNKHHWQYWTIPYEKTLEMPTKYALEMLADWMGSSKAYTGSFDMTDWLKSNLPNFRLHPDTYVYISGILTSGENELCNYDREDLLKWYLAFLIK